MIMNIIDDLNSIKIISKDDIVNLKKYIDIKYSSLDSKKRAEMLSKTIHKILEKYLNGINDKMLLKIKTDILKATIFKGQDTVYLYDILEFYIKENPKVNKEFIDELLIWINNYLKKPINYNEFKEFLIHMNLISYDVLIPNEQVQEGLSNKFCNNNEQLNEEKEHKGYSNIEINIDNNIQNNMESNIQNNIESNIEINTGSSTESEKENNTENNIESNVQNNVKNKGFLVSKKNKLIFVSGLVSMVILGIFIINNFYNPKVKKVEQHKVTYLNNNVIDNIKVGEKIKNEKINENMPPYFLYYEPNQKKLKEYLKQKNSILQEEPYFSSIISSAKKFNINPILLFAITGQEQNFVPRGTNEAKKIANNPFNVFHSWQEYNTNIGDSSEIAARTVFNICKTMPKGKNPFMWINNTYAEDKNWWKGVEKFFKELNNINKENSKSDKDLKQNNGKNKKNKKEK